MYAVWLVWKLQGLHQPQNIPPLFSIQRGAWLNIESFFCIFCIFLKLYDLFPSEKAHTATDAQVKYSSCYSVKKSLSIKNFRWRYLLLRIINN